MKPNLSTPVICSQETCIRFAHISTREQSDKMRSLWLESAVEIGTASIDLAGADNGGLLTLPSHGAGRRRPPSFSATMRQFERIAA